jgi:hypothetical protein
LVWIASITQLCAGASRRNVRLARAYFQVGLSPVLDCRPLTRLGVRPSPTLLVLPSASLPSLLLVRPGVEAGVGSASLEADGVRCFGKGRRLLRRLFATLGGRDARRAAGLSSLAVLSPSPATVATRRPDAGVPGCTCGDETGVERMGSLPLAGVAGECIGLANDRAGRC